MMTSSLFRGVVIASALAAGAGARGEQTSCDPTDIIDVIPLGSVPDIEVTRQNNELFWVSVTPDSAVVDEDGAISASALYVRLGGRDCTVVAEAVRVRQGDSWRELRLAGDNVFAAGYFGDKIRFQDVQIGLNLFLLQRAYCSVELEALIYAANHPPLHSYPYPDPDC
jgi:hypothetical protein